MLTLPLAGIIKNYFPESKVLFLGRTYTKDIINLSEYIDGFINYDDFTKLNTSQKIEYVKGIGADVFLHVFPRRDIAFIAKRAGIPLRVGTRNRAYHWFTCNKLLNLSRKNSDLHEAQLNIKLLEFLGIDTTLSLSSIPAYYGFTKIPLLEERYSEWIDRTKFNLILHPKSKGSAKEWGMANFEKLIMLLPKDQFKIFISGTAEDAKSMKQFIDKNDIATDIT
ncbi:MAG: glycosyltransferase family 9 protein, partial [Bacteroidia bacterium]|nr:glycosyltransferase family 9 protein [Bacteroidia bacterium]